DEGVVPGGQDQGRQGDGRDQGHGGGAGVIVGGAGEAVGRGSVDVVELAQGQPGGEAHRRQVREVRQALAGEADQLLDELLLVEAVVRLGEQAAAALEVDGRVDGPDADEAGDRLG